MSSVKNKRSKKVIPVCQICDEVFNKSTRLLVNCPYCNYETCRKCCETYVLSESSVKCMNPPCGKEWTRKHIRDIFTLVFINGPLKDHREKVLFDKERALLPATQPIIEGKILAKKIEEEISELQVQMRNLNRRVIELYENRNRALNVKSRTNERSLFVRACPDEDCRGFLSSQWKCGICEKWVCPDCHIIKGYTRDADHTCNPDDVATAQLLSADTKPCPQCGTGIFKIDGCDQMWCTQCHTAFSWRTGRTESNVHNPHYFEWQRRNGNEIPRTDINVCRREIDHYLFESFSRLLRGYFSSNSNFRQLLNRIDHIIRYSIHLIHVERPRQPDYERRNEELRVKYLMKEISEEEMRTLLQRDDKKHHRNQEFADVYTLLVNTVTDILYRFYDELNELKDNKYRDKSGEINTNTLNEIDRIVDYANECLTDISHTYSCYRVVIENNIHILRGNHALKYLREKSKTESNTETNENIVANTFIP